MPEMTPEEIRAHEETHGLGAAWGEEENRAVVRVFDPDGANLRNFATGLRNCSGMAMQPGTDTLWCPGNERDHLGADLVPDFLTTVQDGGVRSEERRVGKECVSPGRSRWWHDH